MKEKILNELKNAMKNQNKDLLNVIRMVKGAIQLEEINLKRDLTDDEIVVVISKQIKSRKETLAELKDDSHMELMEKTKKEIDILNRYMPKQMTDDEINDIISQIFDDIKPSSINDFGKVMGKLSSLVKGKADMTLVNKIVKERLSNL